MTRANLKLITKYGTWHLWWGSDAYPDDVRSFLFLLLGLVGMPSVDWLHENNPAGVLHLGSVGNPYYYYEVNQVERTVKAWDSTVYWVNAPEGWKARGYNCWLGANGKYGYSNWRKGKRVKMEVEVADATA